MTQRGRDHAGRHAATEGGWPPPPRPTAAERAELHHLLDAALHGCSWCMEQRLQGLAERLASMRRRTLQQGRIQLAEDLGLRDDPPAAA